jgi:hypothetical protein
MTEDGTMKLSITLKEVAGIFPLGWFDLIERTVPDEVVRLREELAAIPCQTNGPEDAESGCCATCRARAALRSNQDGE